MGLYYFLGFLVAFVIIATLLGFRDNKIYEKRLITFLKNNYGKSPSRTYKPDELDHVRGYFDNHKEDIQVDDITWNDLNMDGVFVRMNYCLSASGEEYLYHMLRTPQMSDDFYDLEKKISFFQKDNEARLKFQLIFSKIGRVVRYSIYDYLKLLDNVFDFSNKKHFAMLALLVGAIALCFFRFGIGIALVLILAVSNVVMYFSEKNKIEPYLATYRYVLKVISSVGYFSKLNYPEVADDLERLNEAAAGLEGFSKGSYILMSPGRLNSGGNPFEMFLDYVRMITHADLIKFNNMYKKLTEKRDDLDAILTVVGRLDALVSVACFRASEEGVYTVPSFEGSSYNAEDLVHPLIEEPVANSIDTDKGILITGSNASGKSTFLKTVAINTLLAQSIHTVLASSYKAPIYRVYSSMALKDDIVGGDSYYMVEIKSMKRILDAAKEEGAPVLCFVDEILRGTNTVERIAASTEILKTFPGGNVICFAATHDIELTALLKDYYGIYHFEGDVTDNDVHFDYKIKEGAATNRNAIKLLGVLGYDRNIVDRAQELADKFNETGVWA